MKRILILPSFDRSVRRLGRQDKKKLAESLESFNLFLVSGELPVGLGLKKINHDKYEFRVNLRLRVVIKVEGEDNYLVMVAGHDEIKRYLRRYRS